MTATPDGAHCHKAVAKMAKEVAGQLYDRVMGLDKVRTTWKARFPDYTEAQLESRFIAMYWGHCIPYARATMAHMLTLGGIPEPVKEDILEALTLDNILMKGRKTLPEWTAGSFLN